MPLTDCLEVSASGLTAERVRMDTISNNLANINTTRTAAGGPYRRQRVIMGERPAESDFAAQLDSAMNSTGRGVQVVKIDQDQSALKRVYDPSHPDAVDGYVMMPNVEPVKEMVDLITATRSYEAGITAINSVKQMTQKALEIGRG